MVWSEHAIGSQVKDIPKTNTTVNLASLMSDLCHIAHNAS